MGAVKPQGVFGGSILSNAIQQLQRKRHKPLVEISGLYSNRELMSTEPLNLKLPLFFHLILHFFLLFQRAGSVPITSSGANCKEILFQLYLP